MLVYLFIIILSVFFSFIAVYSKDVLLQKWLLFCVFLVFLFPLMLRYDIGTDYKNYVAIYNSIKLKRTGSSDIGWSLLNQMLIKLKLESHSVFIVSGFLTLFFYFSKTKNKDLLYYVLVILSFLYFPSYNIVRQILAICIVYYSLRVSKGNFFVNLLFFLFGISIHISTIVFLPILIFNKSLFSKKYKMFYLFLGIIIFLFFYKFDIKILLMKIVGTINPHLTFYLSDKLYGGKVSTSGLTIYFESIFFIVSYFLIDKKRIPQESFCILTYLYIMGLFNYGALFNFFIFSRFKYIYYLFPLLIKPYLKKSKLSNMIIFFFLFVFLCLSIRSNLFLGDNGIIPYKSIMIR